jgi:2-polyprenyl-6-methoxyphenol hydroxylase-like FAD-dependent oxidoreductase
LLAVQILWINLITDGAPALALGLAPPTPEIMRHRPFPAGRNIVAVEARWVVGCDGIRSVTRELCGIGMEGHDIARPWAVFDVTLNDWSETYEANFVYLDVLTVVLTALPEKRWRVYLRPATEESDLAADAAETLRAYAPFASFVDVENPTRFHCHTKVAARFRAGPVFLAGDSAHICSPAEGHGMNCGLQDAFNLAWKLALVCQGADPILLDSYEIERRPAAEMITQSGDNAERNLTMTRPSRAGKPQPRLPRNARRGKGSAS